MCSQLSSYKARDKSQCDTQYGESTFSYLTLVEANRVWKPVCLPLLSKPLRKSCKSVIKGTKLTCAFPVLMLSNHQGVSSDDGMKTSVTKTKIQTLCLEDNSGSRSYRRGSQMQIPWLAKRASPGIFLELCVDPSRPCLKMPW